MPLFSGSPYPGSTSRACGSTLDALLAQVLMRGRTSSGAGGGEAPPVRADLDATIGETGAAQPFRERPWVDGDEDVANMLAAPFRSVEPVGADQDAAGAQYP